MNDLTVFTSDLADLSVAQLVVLPPASLQEYDTLLSAVQTQLKQARDRLTTALEQRYGAEARTALRASGRDFGVTHLTDGALTITYELPKRATWDQQQLTAIAKRIAASGDRVEDFLEIELSVPESRWTAWPPVLKEQFAAARTVKAGKPAFRLAMVGEGTP